MEYATHPKDYANFQGQIQGKLYMSKPQNAQPYQPYKNLLAAAVKRRAAYDIPSMGILRNTHITNL